jgi:hypothetical protein
MTPKEKAYQIVLKFEESLFGYDVFDEDWVKCINCALIAVDELMIEDYLYEDYWFKVKKELKKL